MREDYAKGTRTGPTKRSRNQSQTKNRVRCTRGTLFPYVESHQFFRFGASHAYGGSAEEVQHNSMNSCAIAGANRNGTMAPLHDCDECRPGALSVARGQYGSRRRNARSFTRSPAVAALIVTALVMVLPTSTPIAEAKKTVLKPLPKDQNVISTVHSQTPQHWKDPVVESLVNFVRPGKKRTKTKVVNINELGAAPESLEPTVRQEAETEAAAPKKTQIKVVQPKKKKKVLLLPFQSAETTTEERQESLMGQTEQNAGTTSESGYADDTPGIFLPLPTKESPAKLRQAKQEEIPKERKLLVTKDEAKEKRDIVIKELHKFTKSEGDAAGEGDEDTVVYYYIPEEEETGPGDHPPHGKPATPDVVYDEDGNAIPLSDLHDAGNEVYMEHPAVPPPVEEDVVSTEEDNQTNSISESTTKTASSATSSTDRKMNAVSGYSDDMPQAQDQMIIISTVATMALLVGALSARRLRSRQFLSSCIENESLEDDVAYDAAYTHNAAPGGSMAGGGFRQHPQLHHRIRAGSGAGLMGGEAGTGLMGDGAVGYDTFASPGGNQPPPWKGDLEKFDV